MNSALNTIDEARIAVKIIVYRAKSQENKGFFLNSSKAAMDVKRIREMSGAGEKTAYRILRILAGNPEIDEGDAYWILLICDDYFMGRGINLSTTKSRGYLIEASEKLDVPYPQLAEFMKRSVNRLMDRIFGTYK